MRRVTWFVLAIGVVWCWVGCSGHTGNAPLSAVVGGPDETVVVDGTTIRRYDPGHPVGTVVIDRFLANESVRAELRRFAATGYALDRAASFVLEADRDDGSELTLGILALSPAGPSGLMALHLFCMETGSRFVVVPVRVRGSGATMTVRDPTREVPPDGVVVEVIDPLNPFPGALSAPAWGPAPGATPGLELGSAPTWEVAPELSPARWNWGRWASCVGAILAYSAASCSTQCILTGPGFWYCFTICVTPRVMGGIAGCTFRELTGGD